MGKSLKDLFANAIKSREKPIARILYGAILFGLCFLLFPVLQTNKAIYIESSVDKSPFKVSFYLDIVEISKLLRGYTDAYEDNHEIMQDPLEEWGLDTRDEVVEYEKALAIHLRNVRINKAYLDDYFSGKTVCIQSIGINRRPSIDNTTNFVEKIVLDESGTQKSEFDIILSEEFSEDACPTTLGTILYYDKILGNIPLEAKRVTYLYPFDEHQATLEIWVLVLGYDESGYEEGWFVAPDVVFTPGYQNWVTTAVASEVPLGIGGQTNVAFTIQRPMTYKLLSPLILALFIVMIGLLVRLHDTGSFLEVSVAILLGLWGIKDIIVPTDVTSSTIAEPIIIGLYTLLLAAIPLRFFYNHHPNTNVNHLDIAISDRTVEGIRSAISQGQSVEVLRRWLSEESNNKRRRTAIRLIERALRQNAG